MLSRKKKISFILFLVLRNPPGYGNVKKLINITKCQQGKFWDVDKLMSVITMSKPKVTVLHEKQYNRTQEWVANSNFDALYTSGDKPDDKSEIQELNVETNLIDKLTDITSVTKHLEKRLQNSSPASKIEEICHPDGEQIFKDKNSNSVESIYKFIETLKNDPRVTSKPTLSPWTLYEGRAKTKGETPPNISAILEAEETVRPLSFFTFIYSVLAVGTFFTFQDILVSLLFSPY